VSRLRGRAAGEPEVEQAAWRQGQQVFRVIEVFAKKIKSVFLKNNPHLTWSISLTLEFLGLVNFSV